MEQAKESDAFEAWCLPTEKNTHAKPVRIGGLYETRQDALEAIYFDKIEDPSPDKHEYYRWEVRPVATPSKP